jgi:hypothetical protein
MSTSAEDVYRPVAESVRFENDSLVVELADGRSISAPVSWYPRLEHASSEERENWEVFGSGIHWPEIDEDISVEALLAGKRSNESQSSLKKWLEARDA